MTIGFQSIIFPNNVFDPFDRQFEACISLSLSPDRADEKDSSKILSSPLVVEWKHPVETGVEREEGGRQRARHWRRPLKDTPDSARVLLWAGCVATIYEQ